MASFLHEWDTLAIPSLAYLIPLRFMILWTALSVQLRLPRIVVNPRRLSSLAIPRIDNPSLRNTRMIGASFLSCA